MFEFFKHESKYLYHFTSSKVASDSILGKGTLKLGRYTATNDPKETKDWHFHLGTNLNRNLRDIPELDMDALSLRVGYRLKNTANVLCFSKDRKLTGDHVKDIYSRGFCKPRMWAHYGDNHRGVCLIFDKEILAARIADQFSQEKNIYSGDVQYTNRGVVDNVFISPYCIGYDHLEQVGFDQYVVNHIFTHHQRLFFEKSEDWSTEDEYRWVLFGAEEEDLYVNYGNALKGIVFGNNCGEDDIAGIAAKCEGIAFEQLKWKNCTPWYSFRPEWI